MTVGKLMKTNGSHRHMTLLLAPQELTLYGGGFTLARPMPLAIGVLQGALRRAGHSVSSYDLSTALQEDPQPDAWKALYDVDAVLQSLKRGGEGVLRDRLDRLLDATDVAGCDAAGISLGANNSIFEIHAGMLLAARIRARYGKRVAIGGANADHLLSYEWMYSPLLEAVSELGAALLVGPGDESLPMFLEGKPADRLPGAVRWADGRPVRNPVSAPSFVCPDFDGLALQPYQTSLRRMSAAAEEDQAAEKQLFDVSMPKAQGISARMAALPPDMLRKTLVLPFYFNSGCVFHCAFCVQSREDWTAYCSMEPEAAVRDLKALTEKYRTPYIRFFNNAFNLSMRFTRAFCAAAKREKLHIRFSDCGRFNGLTREDAFQLYDIGCRKLIFGLDTASDTVLKTIDKQLDRAQVENGLRFCREAGIKADLEMIVGLPSEGWREFEESYAFVRGLVEDGLVSQIYVNRYFVLPMSRFGMNPGRYGIALEYQPEAYRLKAGREREIFTAFLHPGHAAAMPMRVDPIRYYEPGGRNADQIARDTLEKYHRMRALTAKV